MRDVTARRNFCSRSVRPATAHPPNVSPGRIKARNAPYESDGRGRLEFSADSHLLGFTDR